MKTGKTPAHKEVQEKELITAYPQAEQLLSAYIPVSDVKAWFLEFKERGADFLQPLKSQPWGTWDFRRQSLVFWKPYG
jgi:uncharacterized glyoxalase superfamily protein PhnB